MNNGEGVTSAPGPGRQGPRGIDAAFLFLFFCGVSIRRIFSCGRCFFSRSNRIPASSKRDGTWVIRCRAHVQQQATQSNPAQVVLVLLQRCARSLLTLFDFFHARNVRSSILARKEEEKKRETYSSTNTFRNNLIKQKHFVANLATLTSRPSRAAIRRRRTRAGAATAGEAVPLT
jgi:hypothetical protein